MISASLFNTKPTELFVCIWPTNTNIEKRAEFIVTSLNAPAQKFDKFPEAGQYKLVLKSKEQAFLAKQNYVLIFNKTADSLDGENFFWTGPKGHKFALSTMDKEEEGGVFFRANQKNKSKPFLEMLAVVGGAINGTERHLSLENYLETYCDASGRGTYAFSIFIRIDFKRAEINFKGSIEPVYKFETDSDLPIKDLPTYDILYKFVKDSTNDEKNLSSRRNIEITAAEVAIKRWEDEQNQPEDPSVCQQDIEKQLKDIINTLNARNEKKLNPNDFIPKFLAYFKGE